MTLTEQFAVAIHTLSDHGVSDSDARRVVACAAQILQKAEADRRGLKDAEWRSLQAGRDLIRKANGAKTKVTETGLAKSESDDFAAGREIMQKFQKGGQ